MPSKIDKYFDDFNKVAELINKVAISLQNYTAARTAIRDYVMSSDDKHYAEVEERLALAIDVLDEAASMAKAGQTIDVICYFIDSINEWGDVAERVRNEFASYQEIVKNKVLTNFSNLTQSGNLLLQTNASITMGIVLDIQVANAAILGYLLNGEDRLVEDAEQAFNSAKTKIDQMKQSSKRVSAVLRSFVDTLDTCATGFREAVASRKAAYKTFHEQLAPLGTKIQDEIEKTHLELIEIQQGINELKILTQHRPKQVPPIH